MNADLLIKNGRITTPAGTYTASIAVTNGRITAITTDSSGITAAETIDATGLNVLPGIVDSEAHPPGEYTPIV